MRIHEVEWADIFPGLELFERLAPESRTALLGLQGLRHTAAEQFGDDLPDLLDAGVLEPIATSDRVRIARDGRPLLVALRAADRCPLLTSDAPSDLLRYIQANYTHALRAELLPEVDHRGDLARILARLVVDPDWIEGLLHEDAPEDYRRAHRHGRSGAPHVLTPAVQRLLAHLVDVLQEGDGTLPIRVIAEAVGPCTTEELDSLLQAGLRYLVLFPGLEDETGQLVVGLAAATRTALANAVAPEPEVLDVELHDLPAYGVLDLRHVLLAVAGGEMRVRTDRYLYKRDREALVEELTEVDPRVGLVGASSKEERLGAAIRTIQDLDFVVVARDDDGKRRLQATAAGRAWLALDPPEQQARLLDGLGVVPVPSPPADARPSHYVREDVGAAWRPTYQHLSQHVDLATGPVALARACAAELARLPREGGFSLRAFVFHACCERNPLHGQGPHADDVRLSKHAYWGPATQEDRHKAWAAALFATLCSILLPWGGLRLGRLPGEDEGEDGADDVVVGLSPLGAYLLGLEPEPPEASVQRARIIVQPNFEVVFLAHDPGAEAELAPFCERLGRGVGTIFRITRSSVSRAAAAGVPRAAVVDTLQRLASEVLPGNVASEVEAWHRRQRVVTLERPWILRCGDADTAARVRAVAGRLVEPLGDDVLVVSQGTSPQALAKLLAPHGVTIDTSATAKPPRPRFAARRRS